MNQQEYNTLKQEVNNLNIQMNSLRQDLLAAMVDIRILKMKATQMMTMRDVIGNISQE